MVQVVPALWRVHWCRWCRVQGLPVSCGVCSVPLSLPFVPLLLLLSCNTCKICLISRFKGGLARFGVVVRACVVLVLCVACGAFVCVNS